MIQKPCLAVFTILHEVGFKTSQKLVLSSVLHCEISHQWPKSPAYWAANGSVGNRFVCIISFRWGLNIP
jgi:hypothetical protein